MAYLLKNTPPLHLEEVCCLTVHSQMVNEMHFLQTCMPELNIKKVADILFYWLQLRFDCFSLSQTLIWNREEYLMPETSLNTQIPILIDNLLIYSRCSSRKDCYTSSKSRTHNCQCFLFFWEFPTNLITKEEGVHSWAFQEHSCGRA